MKETYTDICKMIVKLKEKEAQYAADYIIVYKAFSNQVTTYGEERYGEYEAWKKQTDAYDKLEAIRDVLAHLREAAELIEDIEGM